MYINEFIAFIFRTQAYLATANKSNIRLCLLLLLYILDISITIDILFFGSNCLFFLRNNSTQSLLASPFSGICTHCIFKAMNPKKFLYRKNCSLGSYRLKEHPSLRLSYDQKWIRWLFCFDLGLTPWVTCTCQLVIRAVQEMSSVLNFYISM